jgi:aspartyl-tRNA(Asn)/glutamyl-tRNA(Gln) amidotransferase subunit A
VHAQAGLFPARAAEYTTDVRRRLERAVEVDAADYVAATRRREELRGRLATLLHGGALLVTPVATVPPPRPDDTDKLRDTVMPHTTPQDLAGLPACAVRAGFDENGLPFGVQITGAAGRDGAVLAAARAFFAASGDELQARWPG